jgi:hypothetical protein
LPRAHDGATITLKPLLKEFGTEKYDYTVEEEAVMRAGLGQSKPIDVFKYHRGPMRQVYEDGSFRIRSASQMLLQTKTVGKGGCATLGSRCCPLRGMVLYSEPTVAKEGSSVQSTIPSCGYPRRRCSAKRLAVRVWADIMLTKTNSAASVAHTVTQ